MIDAKTAKKTSDDLNNHSNQANLKSIENTIVEESNRGKYLDNCIWCDTETGEAVHVKQPIERIIDHTGKESVATEWRDHKAPLTYERITND